MRQLLYAQWAASVCLLSLAAAPVPAAQHSGQVAVHARTPYTAADRVIMPLFSKRFLLESSTFSTGVTTASESAAAAPASKPTILQAADVTFRLVGSDAQPFSNATAEAFQQALHNVFNNFSSAAFLFQSAKVMSLALHCSTRHECLQHVIHMCIASTTTT